MFDIKKYVSGFFLIDNKKVIEKWKDVFEQMAVHTRKKKPTELLLAIRPNEDNAIYNYRLLNYRAITYGSMNRALDSTSRILNKINYSIDSDDKVKQYLTTQNFNGYDFFKFLEKIVFKRDIEDPNGFLVWLPTGAGVTDSSQKVEPKPMLLYSEDMYDAQEGVFSFKSQELSLVTISGEEVLAGEVYYILTENEFYKLIQIGEQSERKFETQLAYKHNIGAIPVIVLGGDMNADGFFESYFAPYCAFGDQAIAQFSDWQATMVTCGFPYREEFYTSCEVKTTNKSSHPSVNEQKWEGDEPRRGKGALNLSHETEHRYEAEIQWRPLNKSPYGSIIREIPGAQQDTLLGDKVLAPDIPSIRFIAPPVEVAKYSGESWQKLIEMAEDALHLNLANGTNQSGVAKDRDLEQERAMIDKIANNYFGHIMFNSLKFIEAYLMNVAFGNTKTVINKPATFVIKTEAELIGELALLKQSNVPALFLSQATIELANRRFNGSPTTQKIFEVISIIDPLYIYDTSQKSSMVLSGVISKDAFIRSIYIYSLLLSIAQQKTEQVFVKMSVDEIGKLFDEAIKPYLSSEILPQFDAQGNQIN